MEATNIISALAKVVDAKKSTDKAYRTLSKAFFNGTDETEKQTQNVCERIAIPHRKRQEYLQHSGLWRHNTFRRLRVRRCFVVPRVVGGVNGENAAERKETGNFTRWHGCTYRQFTRGSTLTA